MREVQSSGSSEEATFAACLATILELPLDAVPRLPPGEDVAGWRVSRWLGGLGHASRPVLRPLVHRGGLRADILDEGVIHVGDPVRVR